MPNNHDHQHTFSWGSMFSSISSLTLPNVNGRKHPETHWTISRYWNARRIISGLPSKVVRIPHQRFPQHTQGATEQHHIQCSEEIWEKNMHLYAFKQLLMTRITESSVWRKTCKPSAHSSAESCLQALWSACIFLDPFTAKDGLWNIAPIFKSPMGQLW